MKKALAIILTLALIGSLSVFIYADAADTATVNDYTDATVVLDRDPTGEDGANPVAVWTEGPAITPTLVDFEGGKGIDLSVAAGNENEGAFKMFVYPQISDFTQQDVLRIRVKNNSDKEAYGLWLDFGSMQSAVNGCVTLINKDGSANSWSGQFWGCSPTLPANFDGYFVVDLTLMKGYSADALRNFTDRIKLQFMRGSTTMAGTSITVGSLAMVNRDSLVPAADKPSSILVQSYVGATVVTGRDPSGDEMNSNPVAVYTEGPAVTPTVVDFDGEKGIELAVASGNTDGNAFKMYIYHPGVTNFTQQKLLRIRVKNSSDKEAYGLWMQFGSMHSSVSGCVTLINKDGSTNDWSGKFWGSSPTLPANFDGYFLVDLTKLYDYSADTLRNFTGRISLQFMKGDGPVMADASITVGNAVLVSADAIIPEPAYVTEAKAEIDTKILGKSDEVKALVSAAKAEIDTIAAGTGTDEEKAAAVDAVVDKLCVKAGMLDVKFQVPADLKADSTTGVVRFVTTLDSLDYTNAGFNMTINGKTITYTTDKSLPAITGNEDGIVIDYQPSELYGGSKYFITAVITGIPQSAFGTNITVQPFVTLLDGKVIYGVEKTRTVSSLIEPTR